MKNLISREEVRKKLEEYVYGRISLEDLQFWQDSLYKNNFEPNDKEEDESFINEVLGLIDMSDIDGLDIEKTKKIIKLLKLKEDVKILIKKLYELDKNEK